MFSITIACSTLQFIPMSSATCPIRNLLSSAAMDAIHKTYLAKQKYGSKHNVLDADSRSVALHAAMEAEREALVALDEHIKQHGCKA
jgi:hypothetical protein